MGVYPIQSIIFKENGGSGIKGLMTSVSFFVYLKKLWQPKYDLIYKFKNVGKVYTFFSRPSKQKSSHKNIWNITI